MLEMLEILTQCKKQIIVNRNEMLLQLDINYMRRINSLLHQKVLISHKINQQYNKQLTMIQNAISNLIEQQLCLFISNQKIKDSNTNTNNMESSNINTINAETIQTLKTCMNHAESMTNMSEQEKTLSTKKDSRTKYEYKPIYMTDMKKQNEEIIPTIINNQNEPKHTTIACIKCWQAHAKCTVKRPCNRCVKMCCEDECIIGTRSKKCKKKKVKKYKKKKVKKPKQHIGSGKWSYKGYSDTRRRKAKRIAAKRIDGAEPTVKKRKVDDSVWVSKGNKKLWIRFDRLKAYTRKTNLKKITQKLVIAEISKMENIQTKVYSSDCTMFKRTYKFRNSQVEAAFVEWIRNKETKFGAEFVKYCALLDETIANEEKILMDMFTQSFTYIILFAIFGIEILLNKDYGSRKH